jgi:hypothetical protein
VQSAAAVAIDDFSLDQVAASADEAPSPVLRGRGRCKPSFASSASPAFSPDQPAFQFPVLMQSPCRSSLPLVVGPLLKLHSAVTVGSSRCSSSLASSSCSLGTFFHCAVLCIDATSPAFSVCFSIICAGGTLSLVSGGKPLLLPMKPYDVVTLSSANFPCVLSLDSSIDGVKAVVKVSL